MLIEMAHVLLVVMRAPSCRKLEFSMGRIADADLDNDAVPHWCKNCGSLSVEYSRRCKNCNVYHRRHGRERPRHLWDIDCKCRTCKRPLKGIRKAKGKCDACYEYKRRFGRERPKELWGDGKFGWCECSGQANHLIDDFPLCESCATEYKKGAWN